MKTSEIYDFSECFMLFCYSFHIFANFSTFWRCWRADTILKGAGKDWRTSVFHPEVNLKQVIL